MLYMLSGAYCFACILSVTFNDNFSNIGVQTQHWTSTQFSIPKLLFSVQNQHWTSTQLSIPKLLFSVQTQHWTSTQLSFNSQTLI